MTFWEFRCAMSGIMQMHGATEKKPDMTDEEYDRLCELGDKWSAENGN